MDIETKSIITDGGTFDETMIILSDELERNNQSIIWLEQAKQSVVYYMRMLYSNDPTQILPSLVSFLMVSKPQQNPTIIIDDDEDTSIINLIANLKLKSKIDLKDRDYSRNANSRLEYILYLFSRKVDEIILQKLLRDPITDALDNTIASIIKKNATSDKLVVFNNVDSLLLGKPRNKKQKDELLRRNVIPIDSKQKPFILIFRYLGVLNFVCYSRKENKLFIVTKTNNHVRIMPALKNIIESCAIIEKPLENTKMKWISFNGNLSLEYERIISFYILIELNKLIQKNDKLTTSLRTIASWLSYIDNETMKEFSIYFGRNYFLKQWMKWHNNKAVPIIDGMPQIQYDTDGVDDDNDDGGDERQDNNNNNNNNNNNDMIIIIDNDNNDIKKPDENDDISILSVDDNDEIPEEIEKKDIDQNLSKPISRVLHIVAVLDSGKFISESIIVDLIANYFNKREPDSVLIVDPRDWTDEISKYTKPKRGQKESQAIIKLRESFNQEKIDTILIPIGEDNHWTLAIILKEYETIYYYDSWTGNKKNSSNKYVKKIQEFYKETMNYTDSLLSEPKQDCGSLDCAVYVVNMIDHFTINVNPDKSPMFTIGEMTSKWTRNSIAEFIISIIKKRLSSSSLDTTIIFIADEMVNYSISKESPKPKNSFLAIMKNILYNNTRFYNFIVQSIGSISNFDKKLFIDQLKNSNNNRNNSSPKPDDGKDDMVAEEPNVQQQQPLLLQPSPITTVGGVYYDTVDPIDQCIQWALDQMNAKLWPKDNDYDKLTRMLVEMGYNDTTLDAIISTMKILFSYTTKVSSKNDPDFIMELPTPPTEIQIRKSLEKYRQYKR